MNAFQDVFADLPDGVAILDPVDGVIRAANPRLCELVGYSSAEFQTMSFADLRASSATVEESMASLDTGEHRQTVEWCLETAGGDQFTAEICFGRTTIDDKKRVVAVVRDIGRRTQQELEREHELERTRDLLSKTEQIADVGGWEVDPETREVFWTDHLFELFGVEGDEAPPIEEALDVYHEDDRDVVADAVDRALEAGESFDVEVRFQRPDGETRWLRVQGTPATEDGAVVSLRGAVQDVTERRTRERVLREMYETISDRTQSFEQQVTDLLVLGRAELDIRYGTLSKIDGEDYLFEVVDAADDSIQAGDVVPVGATNCEIVASTKETVVLGDVARDAPDETGRAGYTEWGISSYIGAPVFDEDDEVYGTFCFYDTEPRDEQFSDWEKTFVDLMSRWVSYELQRQQATEMLQEKNEQLEQFASVVSHDLRNPLNVAKLQTDLVGDEHDSEHLRMVEQAHERMETLIDNLLALAREDDTVTEREPVDVAVIAEECWSNVLSTDASLVVESTRTIRAERSRLKQLFENLFRNSVEHGSTGSRAAPDDSVEHGREDVTVTVGDLEDGFYVADDGPGIPDDERDQVFEAGYTTNDDGTGFGLRIVQQVVDAHGWEIRATEAAAGGARFEVTGLQF